MDLPEVTETHAPPHADEDALLMLDFARGDAGAFDALYRRHHQALYRFVRRLLGRDLAAQADEVYQDTWLRVVHARATYQPGRARFRTWLFTLAHHRAIDTLRRSGREVALPEGDDEGGEPFSPAAAGQAPWHAWPRAEPISNLEQSDLVFWRKAGARLLDCLDQLPAVQRSAFLLHHEDGLAVDELAQALQVGFETAKSRLRYAMARLRTCMGAYLEPGFKRRSAS